MYSSAVDLTRESSFKIDFNYNHNEKQETFIYLNRIEKKPMLTSKVYYKRKPGSIQSPLTISTILFILLGVFAGFFLATLLRKSLLNCRTSFCCLSKEGIDQNISPYREKSEDLKDQIDRIKIYKNIEESKNLVFIGVMTAQKYLDTRAKSVFTTWGKNIPGKMSFFSRSGSSSIYNIPLVSLPGVDDSYPPQKKSFMMLKFMHDNYLEKFEWFMRVDDDVYIKPDKLELLLRSLNSSKPQFIGQAGLGNKDEFGLLSLDYDENFCMGGPGIIMSRETLKLVVPHISYCLKNLYSTHEDVEIGRCVRKFANISCTWSYEMQHIFHHNSSGNNAFTGELLSREVLRAISLHPVKKYEYQYRLHNFLNLRKIFDLRQRYLDLKRNILKLKSDLLNMENSNIKKNSTVTIINKKDGETEIDSEFENLIFNKNENISKKFLPNRFLLPASLNMLKCPNKREQRYDFDFFTRSLFSSSYISPKRGLEGFWKRALFETVRQVMDEINQNSIERGRLIDFKDIMYGYARHHPLIGLDFVLDILLVYRKYEGRKMTVPVRRHAYIRNTFTNLIFREDNLESSIFFELPLVYKKKENNLFNNSSFGFYLNDKNGIFKRFIDSVMPSSFLKYFKRDIDTIYESTTSFNEPNMEKITDEYLEKIRSTIKSKVFFINKIISAKTINFVLPLTGRWEIFKRFMINYEDVCLRTNENTKLVVVLFENEDSKLVYDDESGLFIKQSENIVKLFQNLKKKYPKQANDQTLKLIINVSKFSRSIGCELGAATFEQRDLIFFIDVDIFFTHDFLIRARLNTIEFKQVYYPIVYSEYDPDNSIEAIKFLSEVKSKFSKNQKVRDLHLEFNLDTGYWRQFGFGIVCVYNNDLRRVGGFDTSIIGWGKEDVDLYEKFIKSNMTIFRSIDPGLIHVFHKIECDRTLAEEQMIMCLGSKSTSIASQQNLAKLIYENKSNMFHHKFGIYNSTNNGNFFSPIQFP